MNVFIESNFVLTLALRQGEYQAAEQLLTLGKAHTVTLKIPSFCLSEPFSTVKYRANNRNRLRNELEREVRELGRTQPYQAMAHELVQYIIQMADVLQTQMEAVENVIRDIANNCEIIQIDAATLNMAHTYRVSYDMDPQDAIILASVVSDLRHAATRSDSLFISTNVHDFEYPAIQDELLSLGCKYLADFGNGVRYIEWMIKQQG